MPLLYLKSGSRNLLFVLLSVVFVACASLPGDTIKPSQSPNDDNTYRLLTLDNKLEVLLISDPDTKKAAAALDVMVGSGDNPADRQGLAHFLEHMLFLGTDKYPDAAEYEAYVTEHGGSRNAYTSFENTNYFFDINADSLPEALDRFAQFFIAPKFDAQYVEREKNAVEAEYQMGLKSDGRRELDVLQAVINPAHPFSNFSVGSLETLADRPGSSVRDELIAFYDIYYSANQMKLVVLGSESLDELEAMVRPMFGPIPNRGYQPEQISAPLFEPSALPMLVNIKPQASLRQLQVSFPIADYRQEYHANPLSYIGNLVGHEGTGSLLSALKAEGLAEALGAGSGLAWRGGGVFSLNVSLTQAGVEHYQRVLQLMFSYLDKLREEGPQQQLYAEQSRLAALAFRFKSDAEPMGYVSAVASGMHYYAPADVLQGPYMMDNYDPAMLSEVLSQMVAENVLVILSDKNAATDQLSVFYQVPYSSVLIDGSELQSLQAGVAAGLFELPAPNEFIAQDVSLRPRVADNSATPTIVLESARQVVWFKQDNEFRVPKGATYINFRSPVVGQNARQTAAAVLYTELLKDAVNEYTYPALLAGLNFDLYKHAQGISLKITGYNDKQLVLLDHLLQAVVSADFDPVRFENIRQDMIRGLQNVEAKRPGSQAISDLQEALLYGEWGEQALIAELEAINPASLHTYIESFWAGARAETLIYGNYDPARVEQVSAMIARVLPASPPPALPALEVLRLAASEQLQYVVDIPHDDSVVVWYLQGAGDSWHDRGATALTAQIMKSGFFQQLRTEQQLGYIVSTFAWPQLEVPGLVMLIQSPTASARQVATAMDEFTLQVEKSLDEQQFERHKSALIGDILRPDKNLWDRASFYWQSIAYKQIDFAGRESLASAVEDLTMETWLNYYHQTYMTQRRSLQVVAPGRWEQLPDNGFSQYHDATAIKSGHSVYSIQ